MKNPIKEKFLQDVPSKIFEQFLQTLGETNLSKEIPARLRKVLLEEGTFSEIALREAILGKEVLL